MLVLFASTPTPPSHLPTLPTPLPVPVIRHTWGPDAGDSLVLFSDIEDPAYGTVFQGVPNTAKGHCGKTMAIIGKMHTEERWKGVSWLVIADDDTLLRCLCDTCAR